MIRTRRSTSAAKQRAFLDSSPSGTKTGPTNESGALSLPSTYPPSSLIGCDKPPSFADRKTGKVHYAVAVTRSSLKWVERDCPP
ncbi:hypothetical protein CEXT_210291 [Caerostris extrusa]|uniref:Uncharacterized protein n=1 Tax=Caerostris extrusa TaxID=172846 RepID=A0AAV4Y1U0_CAEEX|nr:hypothetical protein CEXT_210291 [Caerostris extrusa]